jgi:transposase
MNTYAYSLGIDLHKRFAYWTLINAEHKILWEGKVITDTEKTQEAAASLPVPLQECRAVIEPVDLWGWYAELLEDCGLTVVLANSLQVALIAKSRMKYDRIDSKILAELLQTGYLPTSYLAPRETRDLRELIRSHVSLVAIRTKLKNRIHAVLSKEGKIPKVTDLYGKRGLAWLQAQTLRPVHRAEIDSRLRVIDSVNMELKTIGKEISFRAKHDADTTILATMPGIGLFTALLLKAEIGSFDRFPNPESLASFSGLITSSRSSAGKLRYGRITKQGSKYIRWSLVQSASLVNSKWGYLFEFFERIKEKRGPKVARIALARKMLTIAWHLVKKKEPFRASFPGISGSVNR